MSSNTKEGAEFLFDAAYYLRENPDVAGSGLPPLEHYLKSGWREGRNPHPTFDTDFYLRTHMADQSEPVCPLVHYVTVGRARGLPTRRDLAVYQDDGPRFGLSAPQEMSWTDDDELLKSLFDADYYTEQYPDVVEHDLDPLEHYLTAGWLEGRDPSAEFDTYYYLERYLSEEDDPGCPLIHYVNVGYAKGLATHSIVDDRFETAEDEGAARKKVSGIDARKLVDPVDDDDRLLVADDFDPKYYLNENPDVRASGIDPLEHYLSGGWREGRNPNPTFDGRFYAEEYMAEDADEMCPLVHFVRTGKAKHAATNPLAHTVAKTAEHADEFEQIVRAVGADFSLIRTGIVRDVVAPMFSPAQYRQKHAIDDSVTDAQAFLQYLVTDFLAGESPGPLFDSAYYAEQTQKSDNPYEGDPAKAYQHWLRHGVYSEKPPVPWFDPDDYLDLNSDLEMEPHLAFLHFIRFGAIEGRSFHPVLSIRQTQLPTEGRSRAQKFLESVGKNTAAFDELTKIRKFWQSDLMEDLLLDAIGIEPEIRAVEEHTLSFLPHWHDAEYHVFEHVRDRLPEKVDNLVLMPFCKLGGADFVGGVLSSTLAGMGSTLVLRTELSDWRRPDWFAAGVKSIDLSAMLRGVEAPLRRRILYELIRELSPKNVFNVNSRLAFETFDAFGSRLKLFTNLHSYYFCADRDLDGREAGYPISYFANIFRHMKTAIFDSAKLPGQLAERYAVPEALRDGMQVLYTPAVTKIRDEPVAEKQIETSADRRKPVILWAGRLDRQKRFDLLVAIARRMRHVKFRCWGAAVLDEPPELSKLPDNVEVNEPFDSFDEMPLTNCDGYLYTSEWDGLPTMLIELGALGMPIVASGVGGVPELIDGTTGWLMLEDASVQDYVDAVTEMLSDPEERIKRARQLQKRVATRHSAKTYRKGLLACMGEG